MSAIYTDPEVLDQFWALVERESGLVGVFGECWLWTGATAHGYGVFHGPPRAGSRKPRQHRAHRFAYRAECGPMSLPILDHLCHSGSTCTRGVDCPHRRCVNPEHLEPVTSRENRRRAKMNRYDTGPKVWPTCIHGHPWRANTVYDPTGRRLCADCLAGFW